MPAKTEVPNFSQLSSAWWCSAGWPDPGVCCALKSGHPRHPSRASYDWPLQGFDVRDYVRGGEE